MKHLKMLGLAALAVMGLMAFLGAGTASAATLERNTTPSANDPIALGTEIESTLEAGSSATLSDTFRISVDTCTSSTVRGRIERDTTSTPPVNPQGRITTLTFGGCSDTTTVVQASTGELEIQHIAGTTNGTVISKGSKVEVFSTALGATCTANTGASTSLGTLTGAGHGLTNATMDINATIPMEGCGITSGKWVGRYEVTSPTGLTVE